MIGAGAPFPPQQTFESGGSDWVIALVVLAAITVVSLLAVWFVRVRSHTRTTGLSETIEPPTELRRAA